MSSTEPKILKTQPSKLVLEQYKEFTKTQAMHT